MGLKLGGRIKFRYSDFVVKEIYKENSDFRASSIVDFDTSQDELFVIPEKEIGSDHLYCDMQKMNQDMQNVIKGLALNQRAAKSRFGFAGLKDKRGVTSQRISIFSPDIEQLKKYGKNMIKLHNFRWGEDKIDIGELYRNKFEIVIRNIGKDRKEIEKIIKEFESKIKIGLPNKFGEQRFGGIRNITHRVGELFILEEPKEAVELYLTHISELEKDEIKDARELISKGEYDKAIKKFPKQGFRYERAILDYLKKYPSDYIGAFQQLPKNMTYLFAHAYQSYLFNRYLDLREEKYAEDMFKIQNIDFVDDRENVLGPLFGYDFEFAGEGVGDIERQVLEEENIKLEDFKVKSYPQMSVSGTRREIKLNVYNFKLIDIFDDEYFEGKRAVKISFELDKGNYATTVIDELIS